MARVPQVTRTIITTVCNVMCLNKISKEPFEKIVKLPRTYKDENKMMKKISKLVDDDTVKAVYVIDSHVEETLYGMTEEKFIENADILPSRK